MILPFLILGALIATTVLVIYRAEADWLNMAILTAMIWGLTIAVSYFCDLHFSNVDKKQINDFYRNFISGMSAGGILLIVLHVWLVQSVIRLFFYLKGK